MNEIYNFLRLNFVDLENKEEEGVVSLFSDKETNYVSNINQYIRNNRKNATQSGQPLNLIEVTISSDKSGLSYLEDVDLESSAKPIQIEDLFNPLNHSSICDNQKDFFRSCYPEYSSVAKNSSIFRHENQCYMVPENGKVFYIRTEKEEIKLKPEDVFPKKIGLAYDILEGKRTYQNFGYYQISEKQEIRFEGFEFSISELKCDTFVISIENDFNSISLNLRDIADDRFIYVSKGDMTKDGFRIRVFEWTRNKR